MNFNYIYRGPIGIVIAILYAISFILPLLMGGYILKNFIKAPKRNESKRKYRTPKTYFAVLIPARNEEKILKFTIEKLKTIDYPRELYDVIVIADNCTDDSAQIARLAGAQVYERHDTTRMSKAHAMNWLFNQQRFVMMNYDAICILDADTILADNFLMEMDNEIADGYEIIQGRVGSTNPTDTLTTAFMTVVLSIQNRIWQLPQANIGRSGFFVGTGVCITTSWLYKIGWNINTLVEDAEFGIQSVLKGGFVRYCDNARFYVEQVRTFNGLWKQQRRWRTGHMACLRLYGRKLLKSVVIDKNKDAICYLILVFIPPYCISAFFQIIIMPVLTVLLFGVDALDPLIWLILFSAQVIINFVMQYIVLHLDQNSSLKLWKGVMAMLIAPVFFGIVDIISLIKPKKEWKLITHGEEMPTRQESIEIFKKKIKKLAKTKEM